MSGVEVITFGCRLNTYESEVMRAEAEKAGLNNAVLVNTCAVTGEAVRQARQAIRRARRADPDLRVIVTGCAAETEHATFSGMAEVDLVVGPNPVLGADNEVERAKRSRSAIDDIAHADEDPPPPRYLRY